MDGTTQQDDAVDPGRQVGLWKTLLQRPKRQLPERQQGQCRHQQDASRNQTFAKAACRRPMLELEHLPQDQHHGQQVTWADKRPHQLRQDERHGVDRLCGRRPMISDVGVACVSAAPPGCVTAPFSASPTSCAYFQRAPDWKSCWRAPRTCGGRPVHRPTARRDSAGSASIEMMSPSFRRPIGPPTAASGPTWPMQKPRVAPENRPSVIRATLSPMPWP